MKPILVDMKDMSDSREVYESRPHPFFIGFIYLILGMVVIAVLWAAFFQMDIVVTGTGTVTANGDCSTVTNTKAGIVTECYIADGQTVEKGQLLYEIEHDELDLQLANYESQKLENEQRLEMLQGYLEWLSDETVELGKYADNPYYTEYSARSRLVTLNIEATRQEYKNEQESYGTKLQTGENLMDYYEDEIAKLTQLSSAVKNRNNPFSGDDAYYYAKVNDYLTQYQNTKAQYDVTIAALQQELNDTWNQIVMLQSAEEGTDNTAQIAQLEAAAKETQQSVETAQLQQLTALTNLETGTIAGIEASILTYQQNLVTSQGNQEEIKNAIDSISETGTADAIENIRQTEIQSVTAEISTCQVREEELETAIAGLDKNISDAAICAPASGIINLAEEPVPGNYLSSGTAVMTIIPQDAEGYLVKSYIDNRDIAKVHEEMPVKYEIAAYPSSEYGTLTGEVEFVSADLKTADEMGSAYYVVDTTIEDMDLYNESGEKMELKTGMLCEVKIVVEQKSVLRYLLEKIKFVD